MLKFNINNSVNQDFSLSSPIIRYLMLNAEKLKILYKTCKYFYAQLQINIVESLCLDDEFEYIDPNPYALRLYPNEWNKLPNNLWLTDHLLLGNTFDLPKLFSKIIRCDLRDLYLAADKKFTMNELKILTRSGTVQEINVDRVIYSAHDSDDKEPLEDILSCLLSAHKIGFDICYVTKNTMKKLMQLNFQQKLKRFSLHGINQMLDVNLMDEFLQKNVEDKANLYFYFSDVDENRLFISQMFEKINAWTPEEKKPRTFPDFFILQ